MSILKTLNILADSAKYDASCSSSGSKRGTNDFKLGKATAGGICHSWSADGRCISLLKILQTNYCIYDCVYCINRRSNDIPRAVFTSRELADLTIDFYRRNYIEGLFLSSAVYKNPDYTMELMCETIRILRDDYSFNGYIHVKLIPGASNELIKKAGLYADRVSANIELPSRKSLALLAPQKDGDKILTSMEDVSTEIKIYKEDKKKKLKNVKSFAPAGQSTQLIVGATPETDWHIMKLASWLYKKVDLRRVYYSAYIPVNNDNNLPSVFNPPLLREHRLYQTDWLIRIYKYNVNELFNENNPNLDINFDPKMNWALRNIDRFPIEINKASFHELLRIPGIGIQSVYKILSQRKVQKVTYEDLSKMRAVLKRAQYFITVNGKYYGETYINPDRIKKSLLNKNQNTFDDHQYRLFKDLEVI